MNQDFKDKLTSLCKQGKGEMAILLAHGEGMSTNEIVLNMLRNDWLLSDCKQMYKLGGYFVTFKTYIKSNFGNNKYFFRDDEARKDFIIQGMKGMVELFITKGRFIEKEIFKIIKDVQTTPN